MGHRPSKITRVNKRASLREGTVAGAMKKYYYGIGVRSKQSHSKQANIDKTHRRLPINFRKARRYSHGTEHADRCHGCARESGRLFASAREVTWLVVTGARARERALVCVGARGRLARCHGREREREAAC